MKKIFASIASIAALVGFVSCQKTEIKPSPIAEGSTVYKAAQDAKNGWDPTGGCIYYFNPSTATNKWIWSRPLVKTIGKHRFCK